MSSYGVNYKTVGLHNQNLMNSVDKVSNINAMTM